MASYRFCRPDDIPLLVQAMNDCYCIHYSENASEHRSWNLSRFKQAMHEYDLWPGCCALTFDGAQPISILVSAKRNDRVNVLYIATHPKYLRQGHASHMLESMSKKLAILAPNTVMEVLVPSNNSSAIPLFEAKQYKFTRRYSNFQLNHFKFDLDIKSESLIQPATVGDLRELSFFQPSQEVVWERNQRSTIQCAKRIQGYTIPTVDGLIAYLLFCKNKETTDIIGLDCERNKNPKQLYPLLLSKLVKNSSNEIVFQKVCEEEISYELLDELGFEKGSDYSLYRL